MPLRYTTDQILLAARRKGMIPNTAARGTADSDILEELTGTLLAEILPPVIRLREEYNVRRQRVALVGSQSAYSVPTRAYLNKLREVWYVKTDGTRKQLLLIPIEDSYRYNSTGNTEPSRFYPEGDQIVLVPTLGTAGGSLEFVFYFRPSLLVIMTAAGVVQSFNAGAKTITLTAVPPTTFVQTVSLLDVHSPEAGAEVRFWDNKVATIAGNVLTMTDPIDGSTFGTRAVAIGDYVCLAGEAVIPCLPRELCPVLVQAAVVELTLALGDVEAATAHSQKFQRQLQEVLEALEVRVTGKPPKLHGRSGVIAAMRRRQW